MSGTAASARMTQEEANNFLRQLEADNARNTAAHKAALAAESRTVGANAFGPPRRSPRQGTGRTSSGLIGGGLQERGRAASARDVSPTASRTTPAAVSASFEAAVAARRAAKAARKTAESSQTRPAPVEATPVRPAPAVTTPARPTPPTGASSSVSSSAAARSTRAEDDWYTPFTTGRTLPTPTSAGGGPSTAATTPAPAPAPTPKPTRLTGGRFAFGSAIVPADDDDPSMLPLLRRTLLGRAAPTTTTTSPATAATAAARRRRLLLLTNPYDPLRPPADDAATREGLALGVVPDARARRWREQQMRIGRWCAAAGHAAVGAIGGVDELTAPERHRLDVYFRRAAVVARRVPVRGGAGRRGGGPAAGYWLSRSRVRNVRAPGAGSVVGGAADGAAGARPAARKAAAHPAAAPVRRISKATPRREPVRSGAGGRATGGGPGESIPMGRTEAGTGTTTPRPFTHSTRASAPSPSPTTARTPTPAGPTTGSPFLSRVAAAPRPESEDVAMAEPIVISSDGSEQFTSEEEDVEDVEGARQSRPTARATGATETARKGVRFGPLPTEEELGRQRGGGVRRIGS